MQLHLITPNVARTPHISRLPASKIGKAGPKAFCWFQSYSAGKPRRHAKFRMADESGLIHKKESGVLHAPKDGPTDSKSWFRPTTNSWLDSPVERRPPMTDKELSDYPHSISKKREKQMDLTKIPCAHGREAWR